jgi:hypothetical protein
VMITVYIGMVTRVLEVLIIQLEVITKSGKFVERVVLQQPNDKLHVHTDPPFVGKHQGRLSSSSNKSSLALLACDTR